MRTVALMLICYYHQDQFEKACPSCILLYEGLQLPIPTPTKLSPTLLEMLPNSWPNEAFSLRSDARAFLVRGTQYLLSPWPGSEISQVMGGCSRHLILLLPLGRNASECGRGNGREMLFENVAALEREREKEIR